MRPTKQCTGKCARVTLLAWHHCTFIRSGSTRPRRRYEIVGVHLLIIFTLTTMVVGTVSIIQEIIASVYVLRARFATCCSHVLDTCARVASCLDNVVLLLDFNATRNLVTQGCTRRTFCMPHVRGFKCDMQCHISQLAEGTRRHACHYRPNRNCSCRS